MLSLQRSDRISNGLVFAQQLQAGLFPTAGGTIAVALALHLFGAN